MEQKRCTAKSKRSGVQCKRVATPGATVCATHGSRAPQVRAAAERRVAEARAKEAAVGYGLPREVSPTQALSEELHRTAGIVSVLDLWVAEIPEEKLDDHHALVRLHAAERKHLADVARTCISVGIEARRVEIAEEQARLLMLAMKGALVDLGVWDHPEAPQIVRRHLAAVA